MKKIEVEFYNKENGEEPAKEFLLSLEKKQRAKMFRAIDALEEYGNMLREPFSKPLIDGIFELRAQVGNDITRVLYFFYSGKKAILTHGFVKKQEKTPVKEILQAKKYRKDYLSRREQ